MIPYNSLKSIFSALSTDLGVTIVRADQRGLASNGTLPYPFGSYKILSDTNEASQCHITSTGVSPEDPTTKLHATYKTANILVSVTFYSKEDIATIWSYAQDCIDWFQGLDGFDTLQQYRMVLTSQPLIVEDRTIFLDTFYETKVGFDIHFIYTYKKIEDIHRIETIRLTPEIDDVIDTEIIYTATNY